MAKADIKSKTIEMVRISEIKKHPKNNHKHKKEQIDRLVKILQYQGFRSPLVVSNLSGNLVAGHARLEAAKKLKMHSVPVTFQDFDSDEQEYAHMTADNALAKDQWAEIDLSEINAEIENLGPDFDLDMLGLKNLTIDVENEGLTDPDEIPENVDTRCKEGDLWILGEHRLLCGDATNVQQVERLMGGEKADMVFTDPPYGIALSNTKGEILGDQSLDVFRDCIPLLHKFSSDQAHVYVYFGVQYTQKCLGFLNEAFKQYNILVQRITHENKPSPDGYFKSNYELCYFSNKGGTPFNHGHLDVSPTTLVDKRYKGDGKAKTYPALLEEKATEHNLKSVHPTQKTVGICEFYQKISSNRGGKVLDLFGGSGSTLIACEKTNRKCFMMELDPHYCDVILSRWEKYTGKEAELDGKTD